MRETCGPASLASVVRYTLYLEAPQSSEGVGLPAPGVFAGPRTGQ